jgi:sugar lactone lactonase YvrE
VVGGNGEGSALDQLDLPFGIFVDNNQTVYVADFANHRIVRWGQGKSSGQLVAGGNGQGNHDDQLYYPSDVVVDQNGTMYISDSYNQRVQQWFRNAPNGQTVIRNTSVHGIALDDRGSLYITDSERGELRRWRAGETVGQVIASGFNRPLNLFVDRDRSVYFVENAKHQVLKIDSETGQIIRVAGGSHGNGTDQLAFPNSVIVDQLGTVYVADADNERIVRWPRGATSGSVIAGGRGRGSQLDQFWSPTDLSFNLQGNLYVVDDTNHRVQKFAIDRSLC